MYVEDIKQKRNILYLKTNFIAMSRLLVFIFCVLSITTVTAQREVIYHVVTRSFFDSNGDGHGDINGIQQKLNYLQYLGVTTISLSPIYQSDFYHNLYASDLEKIDPEYGNFKEYRDLIQDVHRRKMKMYQEIDLQYISAKHLWFTDSFKNTKSAYSGYIYYTDTKNEIPFSLPEITTYQNTKEQVVALNLKNAKVKDLMNKALTYWTDPNADGNFYEGIDGFLFHNMVDKLDKSGKMDNLLKDFWAPLFGNLKKINPNLQLVAMPKDSNTSENEYYTKANADRVLALKLREAIVSFDKQKISKAADSTFSNLGKDKFPVVYIENEDTDRFASASKMNAAKLRAGAVLNFLLGGIPLVYYGQEIGMQGEQLKEETDGNSIPVREAFEWYADETGSGMALWYKETGQWWDKRNMKVNDGVSLEEQDKDPNSLWSYYKELIRLKKLQPSLALGTYDELSNNNDMVFSFTRTYEFEKAVVMINLSDVEQTVQLSSGSLRTDKLKLILGTPNSNFVKGQRGIKLSPYGVQVWRLLP
ncbi:Alpha-amylase precursor [compost metagenome]